MSKITKAIILAAGFGTRLRPLTDSLPKPLIPYNGKPMIENAISRLSSAGVKEFVINTHHLSDKMEEYFLNRTGSEKIVLVHEKEILGTGGALLNAKQYLEGSGSFYVYNTDVETDADLGLLEKAHFQKRALATLALQSRVTSRYILADDCMNIVGRTEGTEQVLYINKPVRWKLGFCGIHLLSENILSLLRGNGEFDIIPEYMRLISEGYMICGYDIGHNIWKDLGKSLPVVS